MKTVLIPKGNGKFRRIHVPDKDEMARLRVLVPALTQRMVEADKSGVMHGFFPGRSCVTNAMQHRGYRFTLKFDLKDFFDTVKASMVKDSWHHAENFEECWIREPLSDLQFGQQVWYKAHAGVPLLEGRVKSKHLTQDAYFVVYNCNGEWNNFHNYTAELTDACTLRTSEQVNGYAGQGLPTSPILANIAAAKMDEQIVKLSRRAGRFDNRFAYTRYADDLTFSFNDQRLVAVLKDAVPRIVAECGFVLNEKKTRLQCADYGRRMVTGIAVDDQVHSRRETKRRLRAAKHQGNAPQVCGLEEYCKLKVPKKYVAPSRVSKIVHQVADAVTHRVEAVKRAFGLRKFRL